MGFMYRTGQAGNNQAGFPARPIQYGVDSLRWRWGREVARLPAAAALGIQPFSCLGVPCACGEAGLPSSLRFRPWPVLSAFGEGPALSGTSATDLGFPPWLSASGSQSGHRALAGGSAPAAAVLSSPATLLAGPAALLAGCLTPAAADKDPVSAINKLCQVHHRACALK